MKKCPVYCLGNMEWKWRNKLGYLICLIQVQLDEHCILYFILDNFSYTCFGCYLQPSSGAQRQRTAIGFVSVENRGFSIKWCGGLFYVDLCVLVFQCLVWYLCAGVCVIGSVLVLRGHDVWFLHRQFLRYICVLTVWCVIPLEQVLVWDSFTLSAVSYRLLREVFERRVLGLSVVTFVVGNFNSCLIQNECLRGHASCNKRMFVGTPWHSVLIFFEDRLLKMGNSKRWTGGVAVSVTCLNPFWSYVGPRPTLWSSRSTPMSEDVRHFLFCCVCSPAPLSEPVRRFSSCSTDFSQRIAQVVLFLFLGRPCVLKL
jgi:hypothetical protein